MTTSTATALKDFEKILRTHTVQVSENSLDEILEKMERVNHVEPSVYEHDEVSEFLHIRSRVLQSLTDQYITTAIAQIGELPIIDDSLFNLKRYLRIGGNGRQARMVQDNLEKTSGEGMTVTVPLFVYVPLSKYKEPITLGEYRHKVTYGDRWERYTKTITTKITAKLPGMIGPRLRKMEREALSKYFGILEEAYSRPVIGDILARQEMDVPEFGATWIPTPESLSVKVEEKIVKHTPPFRDPAMLMTILGKRYLVGTWAVDDEEPFEHYLREYSHGDLKGKISKKK